MLSARSEPGALPTLGDGIRRNIATVDPRERALLKNAFVELNRRHFPGDRRDLPAPGNVSWWFKQDEIHQGTHVHGGPEFIPWHREIVNRLEGMLRQIDPRLSLHYWDWTQDPRAIPNANLGGGMRGVLNLFTDDFMGYGGAEQKPIGEPWLTAGFYAPSAAQHRNATGNPADPPREVVRSIEGNQASFAQDQAILHSADYAIMRLLMEDLHDAMHGFVNMGGLHVSFRDPFVFLLHSNLDRLFARWQTDPQHPERLKATGLYGTENGDPGLNGNIEPWSTGHSRELVTGAEHFIRPWYAPEREGRPKSYKDPSLVFPRYFDTNHPYLYWTGNFSGAAAGEVLFWFDDGNWWLGSFAGTQLQFTAAGNTLGFGNLADGAHPSWVGDFTGAGKTELLFNYVGDGNWWLGTFTGNQLSFRKVSNTLGFGDLTDGAHPSWVGDFTGSGKAEILFNYVGDGNWWLGTFTGNQLAFTKVGNTLGFGDLADGAHPSWLGNFTGSGKTELLFNYVGDGNWWLGTLTGKQFAFTKAGNTLGFGNLADGAHPTWVGDFTGSGKADVVFNYEVDGNWWLGTFTGTQIGFSKVANTVGFGNLADGEHPAWIGDFSGLGKTEILFNYVGDGNWWLGSFTADQVANKLTFARVGNTKGFGDLADGSHPSWVGDFTGSGKSAVLFNYEGDGNWWLGTLASNQLTFAGTGKTGVRLGMLHGSRLIAANRKS